MHMDDDDIILEQVPDIDMFNLDDDLLDQLSPGAKEVCLLNSQFSSFNNFNYLMGHGKLLKCNNQAGVI